MSFKCPHCGSSLLAAEDELGEADTCPDCAKQFIVAPEAAAALRAQEAATAKAVDELAAEREAQQALKRQEAAESQKEELAYAESQRLKAEARREKERRQRAERSAFDVEKNEFRNADIRKYPALQGVREYCSLGILINVGLSVTMGIVVALSSVADAIKVISIAMIVIECFAAVFVLKLISELVQMSVNIAQDTERMLRMKEADAGKPWASV